MKPNTKIKIAELLAKPVGESADYKLPPNLDFEYGDIKTAVPIEGKIKLTNLGNRIFADFSIKTRLNFVCSRCLKNFKKFVALNFQQEYLRPEKAKKNELADTPSEFLIKNYEIDAQPAIFNEIVLNLPLKPLCKKNCKGLCQNCGMDLNKKKCKCKVNRESSANLFANIRK